MLIEFSDQAWSTFSANAEENGVISQHIVYIIEMIRKEPTHDGTIGEKIGQVGDAVIRYEITSDRVIIKSIVNVRDNISDRASRGDVRKYRKVLDKVPDVPPLESDQ